MAAMGILEKKAVEHAMAGDFKAADIYEKLANLRLNWYGVWIYVMCSENGSGAWLPKNDR